MNYAKVIEFILVTSLKVFLSFTNVYVIQNTTTTGNYIHDIP
jgi:hypothetical protein